MRYSSLGNTTPSCGPSALVAHCVAAGAEQGRFRILRLSRKQLSHSALFIQALAVLMAIVPPVESNDELKRKVLEEAPPAWEQLERLATHIQASGTMLFESEGIDGAPPARRETWDFFSSGSLVKAINRRPGPGGHGQTGRAYVIGDRYHFVVQNDDKTEWLIRYVGPVRREIDQRLALGVGRFISAPWAIAGVRLSDLLKSDGFTVHDVVEERGEDGGCCVAMRFTNAPSQVDITGVRSGRIVFDPSMHWAIRSAELVGGGALLQRITVQYGSDELGRPLLKFVSAARVNNEGTQKQELSFAFDNYDHREPPASEFTLENFGIDPRRGNAAPLMDGEKQTSTRFQLVVLGLLCIVLSYVFYKRRAHLNVS